MATEDDGPLLNAVASEVQALTARAFQRLMKDIRSGVEPVVALRTAYTSFEGRYIDALAAAFSTLLRTTIGTSTTRKYPIGPIKLSDRLYANRLETEAVAIRQFKKHSKALHDARELAMTLYEGYEYKTDTLKVIKALPKYLRKEFDRSQARKLKTPALRVAYLQSIDAKARGEGMAQLSRFLQIAWYERNRAFANRIAQTELHRAHSLIRASEIMADASIEYVQIRLSRSHPEPDICDLFARQNFCGLGPGVYPKAATPLPPFHPHCRCLIAPRLDLTGTTIAGILGDAGRVFLRSLEPGEAGRVIGSAQSLRQALDGRPIRAILDAGTDPIYRLRTFGDVDGVPGSDWVHAAGLRVKVVA